MLCWMRNRILNNIGTLCDQDWSNTILFMQRECFNQEQDIRTSVKMSPATVNEDFDVPFPLIEVYCVAMI